MGLFDEMLETKSEELELLGKINSVAIGVVKENWDDKHPGMVKVEISLGNSGKNLTDWIPVASFYAGNGFGNYWHPEIGTQVVLGFHMGDINCPIVMGALWNQTDVIPAETANEKNTVKLMKTKGGNSIKISEESGKEKITVETKGKLKLELDDENKRMVLQDETGENSIAVDTKNGELSFVGKSKAVFKINGKEMLVLDGSGDSAELKAGNIQVQASQGLNMKAQTVNQEGSSTKMKGQSIQMEAQTALSLKGSGSLKAESSGITEIKGSMLKLN